MPRRQPPVQRSSRLGIKWILTISLSMYVRFALPSREGHKASTTQDLLGPLRVDVERYIPLENPYTYEGTNGPWNEQELHCAFVKARVIEIDLPITDRPSTMFNLSPSDNPGVPVGNFKDFPNTPSSKGKTWNLKITKCGLLNRKDDTSEGGKKNANRKWKSWSVVLTGSQLLFFRDTSTLQTLSTDFSTHPPPTTILKPDELFSLKDSIAVYDRSYTKVTYMSFKRHIVVTDSIPVPACPKICLA